MTKRVKDRPVTAKVSIQKAACEVYTTDRRGISCPLCSTHVPPNVRHECEVDGGVRTVRNR